MKNIILFLIVFALLFGCNSSNKETTSNVEASEVKNLDIQNINLETPEPKIIEKKIVETNDSIIYTNYGFTITYPKDWELIETNTSTKIAIISKFENDGDNFRENIVIGTEDLLTTVTVQEYAIKNIEDIEKRAGMRSESEDTIEINGLQAYKIVFTSRIKNDISIKQMQTYIIKDNTAYILTYTAEEKNFDLYLDRINEMVSSFIVN